MATGLRLYEMGAPVQKDPMTKDLAICNRHSTSRDLVLPRACFGGKSFLEFLLKAVSEFAVDAGVSIFTPAPPESCTLALSPKQPWYQQLTHASLDSVCEAIGFGSSFIDALEPAVLRGAEKACTNAARAYIAEYSLELAWMTEDASLAAGLAAYLLADVVCKVALTVLTDISVSTFISEVCKVGVTHLPWPEITSESGLPCKDAGLPITPGIVPAAIPSGVLPKPAPAPSAGIGAFTFDEVVHLPCTTCALGNIIEAGQPAIGQRFAQALCPPGNAEDTSALCAQVCADQCRMPPGVQEFMKK